MAKPVLYLFASTPFLATALAVACYHPDGSPAPNDYQPCDPSAEVSMCCRVGGNPPHNVCQPYGICLELDNNVMWRESCTDKAWGPHCLHLCTDKSDPHNAKDIPLTLCQNGGYCCGSSNYPCCGGPREFYILGNGSVTNTPPSTATSTSTPSATQTPTCTPVPSHGRDVRLAAGLDIGLPFVVIALMLFVLLRLLRLEQALRRLEPKQNPEYFSHRGRQGPQDPLLSQPYRARQEPQCTPGPARDMRNPPPYGTL